MARPTHVLGYELDAALVPVRKYIDTRKPGDYGCDPLPDGRFRMVPSGDVVDAQEKARRLVRDRAQDALYDMGIVPTDAMGLSPARPYGTHCLNGLQCVIDYGSCICICDGCRSPKR